jgi:hypothetical protein
MKLAGLAPFPAALGAVLCLIALAAAPARADKLVLKDGRSLFGTITDERDSLIRYFDRYDRPRRMKSSEVDTIHYDSRKVHGRVKVAFRKGQPKDRSGLFRLRHSEELDLDAEYSTDSASELDLFFRNGVHLRVLAGSRFRVLEAPRSKDGPVDLELSAGRVLASGNGSGALLRISTPGGVGVGRGDFQSAVRSGGKDSSILVSCLKGLCGVQETLENPGELVVEPGQVTGLGRKEGVFEPRDPDPAEVAELEMLASKVGHYRFSEIEYPKIGYLPKAITGLGFMVFFYGSAIGILNYVNNI